MNKINSIKEIFIMSSEGLFCLIVALLLNILFIYVAITMDAYALVMLLITIPLLYMTWHTRNYNGEYDLC